MTMTSISFPQKQQHKALGLAVKSLLTGNDFEKSVCKITFSALSMILQRTVETVPKQEADGEREVEESSEALPPAKLRKSTPMPAENQAGAGSVVGEGAGEGA